MKRHDLNVLTDVLMQSLNNTPSSPRGFVTSFDIKSKNERKGERDWLKLIKDIDKLTIKNNKVACER